MRQQIISVARAVLCGVGLALTFGCNHSSQPVVSAATSIDQQIQRVQSNPDLSDQQKQHIEDMLKASHAPSTAK